MGIKLVKQLMMLLSKLTGFGGVVERPRRYRDEVIATDHGFVGLYSTYAETVLFEDVIKVMAYKIDQITVDCVCCDIFTRCGSQVYSRTIHEDLPGFDAVIAGFEKLPGFFKEWRGVVIQPAFAANLTTLYDRTGEAD